MAELVEGPPDKAIVQLTRRCSRVAEGLHTHRRINRGNRLIFVVRRPVQQRLLQSSEQHEHQMRREWRERFRDQPCPGFSCEDVTGAVTAIAECEEVSSKNIISLFAIDVSHMFVKTGVIRGPLSGGGQDVLLEKDCNDEWKVLETAFWIS